MQSLMELINAKKQQIDASKRPNAKRIAEGRSRLRILPSWRGDINESFWHDYGQHYIKDANNDVKAVYICTERTFGRPCEVCSAISSAAKSTGDDNLTKIITEAKAGSRTLVNALHIDGQSPTTPEVYELPPTVFEQFIGLMQLYLQEGVNILDLKDGFDVSIERTGKGLSTKYTLAAAPKTSSVNSDVMTKVQDLDKYVAQENEQNRIRAISEIRAVAGLSNGAGSTLTLPASTASLLDVEEDLTQQIPTSAPVAAIAPVTQAVVDVSFTETAKPAAAAIAAAQAQVAAVQASVASTVAEAATAVAIGTGDADLDAMLAELNNPA